MHETIIANNIITEAKKHGDVKSILIEVGELAHLPSYELKDILKEMTNWEIKVIEKKSKVKCICGFVGPAKIIAKGHDYSLFRCPWCDSIPEVIEGNEIILKEVKCAMPFLER